MPISRRFLLRALPAFPLAAKGVKDEIEKQVGASVLGTRADDYMPSMRMGIDQDDEEATSAQKILEAIRNNGVPDWKRKEIKKWASSTRRLDPDIAALQSVSIGHKLRMQREINEQRMLDDLEENLLRRITSGKWLRSIGSRWW